MLPRYRHGSIRPRHRRLRRRWCGSPPRWPPQSIATAESLRCESSVKACLLSCNPERSKSSRVGSFHPPCGTALPLTLRSGSRFPSKSAVRRFRNPGRNRQPGTRTSRLLRGPLRGFPSLVRFRDAGEFGGRETGNIAFGEDSIHAILRFLEWRASATARASRVSSRYGSHPADPARQRCMLRSCAAA